MLSLILTCYAVILSLFDGLALANSHVKSEPCEVSYVTVPGPTVTVHYLPSTFGVMSIYTTVETYVRTYVETVTVQTTTFSAPAVYLTQTPSTLSVANVDSSSGKRPTNRMTTFSYLFPVYPFPVHSTTTLYSTITHTTLVPSVHPVKSTRSVSGHFTSTIRFTSYKTIHSTLTTTVTLIHSGSGSTGTTPKQQGTTAQETRALTPKITSAFSTSAPLFSRVSTDIHTPSKTESTRPSSPSASACGEYGNFTLNWDDEPSFTPTDPENAPYPPVFNPYHQFFFSNGYAYVPNSRSPYQAVSPPQMAIFLPNSTEDHGSPYAAGGRPGEVSAGPRASLNAFWFNAYGAYLGCDDGGPKGCRIDIKGFSWNDTVQKEVMTARRIISLPPCVGLQGCKMEYVGFTSQFNRLSGIQIFATINGAPRIFFMDNLRMGWYNNSCEAGLYRLTQRK